MLSSSEGMLISNKGALGVGASPLQLHKSMKPINSESTFLILMVIDIMLAFKNLDSVLVQARRHEFLVI